MLRIFAAVLRWRIFHGDCLTTTENGVCCESLRKFCGGQSFTVIALRQLRMAFAANLCGSFAVANFLRLMPYDNWKWLLLRIFPAVLSRIFYGDCLTTTGSGFCCEALRQFCRKSFTVNYDNWQWLLLRKFAANLSRIFHGERLTTTDSGFCCESLRQFCGGESFTVIALRQLRMDFAANLCGSSAVENLSR